MIVDSYRILIAIALVVCACSTVSAQYTLSTLASFDGTNGQTVYGGLVADANGNLYGTTYQGGTNHDGNVFELASDANHTLSTLASFSGPNGAGPYGGLIMDANGNLYGSTFGGGTNRGAVYEVANDANHTLTALAIFPFDGSKGNAPIGNLVADANGNLYGASFAGGANNSGAVFEVANDANHTLSATVSFNGTNGSAPEAGLVADASGNLYGTTFAGGANSDGTVFKIANDANHTLSTLVSFNGANGQYPESSLIVDAGGNLYGTTVLGGANNYGTVFEVANDANHTLTTLATFDGTNGKNPFAGLIADSSGNLYGTTSVGGAYNYGTIFKLSPVPEPSSLLLSTIGVASMFGRALYRKRRRIV